MDEFLSKKVVINIDLSKLKELCLNGKYPELSALAILDANDEEMEILSKNNETAKELKQRIEDFNNDENCKMLAEAYDKAMIKKDQFLEKWAKETAKDMLDKGIDISSISDITYLTRAEIEALK